jgi:hypothetical protein
MDQTKTIITVNGDVNGSITITNNYYWALPGEFFFRAYQALPKKEDVSKRTVAAVQSALVQTGCLPTITPPEFYDGSQLAKFYLSDGFFGNTVSEGVNPTSFGPEYAWVNTGCKGDSPSLQVILGIAKPIEIEFHRKGNTIVKHYKDSELSEIKMLLDRFKQLAQRHGKTQPERSYYRAIVAGLMAFVPHNGNCACPDI